MTKVIGSGDETSTAFMRIKRGKAPGFDRSSTLEEDKFH
jgi:hypothetical protein